MMQNPDRICFSIGPVNVYWYGVLMATGIVVAILLAMQEAKRKKLYADAIIDACLIMIPMGVIGARLYYVIFEWETYAANPISALYIWQGGLAMYGSMIGGLLGLFIFSRWKKIRFTKMIDCIAPGVVLAQAIGRWGNFFNQEAFGLPVTQGMMERLPMLRYFPFSVYIEGAHSFDGVFCTNPVHLATFFYESAWCLLVAIALWCMRKKFKHDGDCFLTYLLLYAFERMFVEGLRGDSLYLLQSGGVFAGGIRVSQMLSFLAVVAIGLFFIIRAAREKKEGRLMWPAPETTDADDAAAMEATEEAEEAAGTGALEGTENAQQTAEGESADESADENADESAADNAVDAEDAPNGMND